MWLDAERGRQLLAPLGADLQQSMMPQTAPASCPWCGQSMHICLTRLAGVEIDVCASHGVWFDRHELERVSQAVARITGHALPQAPAAWSQAHGPGHGHGHGHGHGDPRGGVHPGMAVGAAAVGAAAVGVAAYAAFGGSPEDPTRSSFGATDALSVAPDVVSTGSDVADVVGGGEATAAAASVGEVAGETAGGVADAAGDALSSVAEVGADAAEAAGSVLGSIFEAITGIFS